MAEKFPLDKILTISVAEWAETLYAKGALSDYRALGVHNAGLVSEPSSILESFATCVPLSASVVVDYRVQIVPGLEGNLFYTASGTALTYR